MGTPCVRLLSGRVEDAADDFLGVFVGAVVAAERFDDEVGHDAERVLTLRKAYVVIVLRDEEVTDLFDVSGFPRVLSAVICADERAQSRHCLSCLFDAFRLGDVPAGPN